MTKLEGDSVVRRETTTQHRGRNLCVEVHGRFIKIWPKGTRSPESSTNVDILNAYENGLLRDARLKS